MSLCTPLLMCTTARWSMVDESASTSRIPDTTAPTAERTDLPWATERGSVVRSGASRKGKSWRWCGYLVNHLWTTLLPRGPMSARTRFLPRVRAKGGARRGTSWSGWIEWRGSVRRRRRGAASHQLFSTGPEASPKLSGGRTILKFLLRRAPCLAPSGGWDGRACGSESWMVWATPKEGDLGGGPLGRSEERRGAAGEAAASAAGGGGDAGRGGAGRRLETMGSAHALLGARRSGRAAGEGCSARLLERPPAAGVARAPVGCPGLAGPPRPEPEPEQAEQAEEKEALSSPVLAAPHPGGSQRMRRNPSVTCRRPGRAAVPEVGTTESVPSAHRGRQGAPHGCLQHFESHGLLPSAPQPPPALPACPVNSLRTLRVSLPSQLRAGTNPDRNPRRSRGCGKGRPVAPSVRL